MLATQTLAQRKPRSMVIRYEGELGFGVTAKDLILGTIGQMGTGGAAGHVVEYAGPVIEGLSMEGRMTICNMTIEGGGRAGMIAPDDTTFAGSRSRPARRAEDLEAAVAGWRELRTEAGASFDKEVVVDAARALAADHLGHDARDGRPGHRRRARAALRRRRARAEVHGARGRDADAGDRARPRVHRLLHELADRRPARRRRGGQGPQGRDARQRDGRARLPAGRDRRPSRRASTRSSAPRASTGAARAARCAWG